ncbi:hypothetical protein [Ideonella dechloratans]|uniref:hypothetical protein n=1 Tax=Ideonella dechloratans TaxID=36863 RepID=UPI0035B4B9C1
MLFRMLLDEATGTVSYLLTQAETGDAVVIDPRAADVPVIRAMLAEQRAQLRWVLRTHAHDAQRAPAEQAALDQLGAPWVQHRPPAQPLLPLGDDYIEVLATPGHTPDCLSFRWRDRLFCGDLLVVDGCHYQTRPAQPQSLWDSVHDVVFRLPDETLLFAGCARRGRMVATVGEQRRWHPWFGNTSRDAFLTRVARLPPQAGEHPAAH